MAPVFGKQTFYSNSPPEAVEINSSEDISDLSSDPTIAAQKPRKKLAILILVVTILTAATLGVGLGLGLRRRGEKDANRTSTLVTQPVLQRGMMDNTSIAAATLPNGDRNVFFQENSGAVRRTLYSIEENVWQAPVSMRIASDAKNNTPLAAMTFWPLSIEADVGNASRLYFSKLTLLQAVALFYVSGSNTLSCVGWVRGKPQNCEFLEAFPKIPVAPDSRQISATVLSASGKGMSGSFSLGTKGILITYQDPAQRLSFLCFSPGPLSRDSKSSKPPWSMRNLTFDFNSGLQGTISDARDIHAAVACSAAFPNDFSNATAWNARAPRFDIYCFKKHNYETNSTHDGSVVQFSFSINRDFPYNLTVDNGSYARLP